VAPGQRVRQARVSLTPRAAGCASQLRIPTGTRLTPSRSTRYEGGSSASRESSEMVGGDGRRDPFAGLGVHGVEHLRVNWAEDLHGERGVERLVVG